jgi:hypothetical protein
MIVLHRRSIHALEQFLSSSNLIFVLDRADNMSGAWY